MSISNFKIKEGLDLDGLVLTNSNGTLYADGSAVGTTYIDSVSTDFDVTNGLLGLSQNSSIATKSYVDATAQGLDVKASVKIASTANLDFTSLGSADVDGTYLYTMADGERILLKNQVSTSENGIYVVSNSGGNTSINRSDDATFDANGEGTLTKGSFVFVENGTNAGKGFVANAGIMQGTAYVTWSQFSETGSYITSVGTNLSVGDGNSGTTLGELNLGANVLTTDSLGSGLFYSPTSSTIDVQLGTGLIANGSNQIEVDRLTVDTWYDAAGAASTAETNANSYTDTALNDYTTTANLDTTIDGYGYLKSADLSGYATETYVDTAVGNIDLSSKQNVLTAGNGIDITNDTISLDSDVIVTSVALTDATTGVSAGSDVLGNATNTTYAMGSAQTVYTFATGTKTADIFVQIVNASGDTRTSKITAVFNGGSAPIWTEYGIVDSGTAMATTVSFDSYAFKINITGSSTYAVHGVTTFLS